MALFSSQGPFDIDGLPWLRSHPDLGSMGRFAERFRDDDHHDYVMTFKPRTSGNPINRLLEAVRLVDGGRGEYANWARDLRDNSQFWTRQDRRYPQYTEEEYRHAYRVLSRLAALQEVS